MTATHAIGDTVLINGYEPSTIRCVCVERTITDVRKIGDGAWYKVGIGANMYSYYPERRVKSITKVVTIAPPCTALMIRPPAALMVIA